MPPRSSATRDLMPPGPEVVAYTCAAGSFVHGAAGSCALGQAMMPPCACSGGRRWTRGAPHLSGRLPFHGSGRGDPHGVGGSEGSG